MYRTRSRTTLEDFVQSYFPLHGLLIPDDFFKFLDILVFVEASIYAMDEENERLTAAGCEMPSHELHGEKVLRQVLSARGLMVSAHNMILLIVCMNLSELSMSEILFISGPVLGNCSLLRWGGGAFLLF